MSSVLLSGANGALGTVVSTVLQQAGWNVIPLNYPAVDLTDDASTAAACADLPTDLSAIVHLAGGIVAGARVPQTSAQDVANMFALNTFSAFNLMRHALPRLEQNGGGSVVMIGAQSVLHPVGGRSAYAAAKAALVSLMQSIAEEGRTTNVRANAILPSILRTPANLSWAQDGEESQWVLPESVAMAIVDLCAPTCMMSGAIIPMYGGIAY